MPTAAPAQTPAAAAAALTALASASQSAEIRIAIPEGPLRFFQRADALVREDEMGVSAQSGEEDGPESSRTCHLDNPHLVRPPTRPSGIPPG